jgi:hypothetical protein
MMNSIHFGLALIAILIILHWYIQNDGSGQNDGSVGLLAMKTGKPKAAAPAAPGKKRLFRRKARG